MYSFVHYYPVRSFFANKSAPHIMQYFTSRKISGFSRGAIQGKSQPSIFIIIVALGIVNNFRNYKYAGIAEMTLLGGTDTTENGLMGRENP